ncbi:MAG: hypothetical protein M3261_01755 [Thermoproteota archaeon]|nr:hypothetical protein [Thermoproteota archaeon]
MTATRVTITTIAIAIVLIGSNFTFINAQQSNSLPQQQAPQQLANNPGQVQNGTAAIPSATTYQNANDSFRVQVPQGWTISDLNNTGLVLSQESTRGYGILAQLCPEGEQQGLSQQRTAAASSNAGSSNDTSNCQGSESNVIHIIRYPNLNNSLFTNSSTMNSSNTATTSTTPTIGNVLNYHLQKLQQVGYHDIKIVRNSAMRVNLTSATDANQTLKTAPGWFAQIAYTTAMEPNRTNTGYFVLTFTNGTAPDAATMKGYAVFYEGGPTNRTSAGPGIAATSGSSAPLQQPSPAVAQIMRSFELILTPEVAQTLAQQAAAQAQSSPVTSTADTSEAETNTTDTSAAEATTGAVEDTEDTADDDDGGDDDGDEGEGNSRPNTLDEFADCIVMGAGSVEDTGC